MGDLCGNIGLLYLPSGSTGVVCGGRYGNHNFMGDHGWINKSGEDKTYQ